MHIGAGCVLTTWVQNPIAPKTVQDEANSCKAMHEYTMTSIASDQIAYQEDGLSFDPLFELV